MTSSSPMKTSPIKSSPMKSSPMKSMLMKNETRPALSASLLLSLLVIMLASCNQTYSPRPYGFFRIELPEHSYELYSNTTIPYSFVKADIATIVPRTHEGEKYWIDVTYPMLNANIHCSYKEIDNNFFELSEDARRYVYKHSVMADGIEEQVFVNDEMNVYGILYDIKGNTASSIQFVLTDSSKHFFRAALYFDNVPNKDSIAPVVSYLREDVVRLIESFEWNK